MKPMTEAEFMSRIGWSPFGADAELVEDATREFLRSMGFEDAARALGDYVVRLRDQFVELQFMQMAVGGGDEVARAHLKTLVNMLREGRVEDAEKYAKEVEL